MVRIGTMSDRAKLLWRHVVDRPTRVSLKYRVAPCRAQNQNKAYELCTATIVHNEAKYISEFVGFHKLVGVDHMLIYDDSSTDDLKEVLAPFVSAGFVSLFDWPRTSKHRNNQFAAYQHAVELMCGKTTWLAMIDADEFLFAPASGNLKEELRARQAYCALGVYSRTFGSGGIKDIPPGGLVTEWLTKRAKLDHAKNRTQRSIVKPKCVSAIRSANTCVLKGTPLLGWDEAGLAIRNTGEAGHSSDSLRINHYFTRSEHDFQKKLQRHYFGKSDHAEKMRAKLAESVALSEDNDTEIHRYLEALRKELDEVGGTASGDYKASSRQDAKSIG